MLNQNHKSSQDPPPSFTRLSRRWAIRQLSRLVPPLECKPLFSGPLKRMIIITQEKLGDAILLTPLLRLLTDHVSNLSIHIIALSRPTADFFRRDSRVERVFEPKVGYFSYLRQIRGENYDVLLIPKIILRQIFCFILDWFEPDLRWESLKRKSGKQYHFSLENVIVQFYRFIPCGTFLLWRCQ